MAIILPKRRADLAGIVQVVAEAYDLKPEDLKAPHREQPAAFARQVAMYIAARTTGQTLSAIGGYLGRDHTTTSYSVNKIQRLLARTEDPIENADRQELRNLIETLKDRLKLPEKSTN